MFRPPALRPPGPIGLVAPSSAPRSPELLELGVATLRARGYDVVRKTPLEGPRGYLASPDVDRIAEFNAMLRRTDVHTVMCARGGYGALRLLDHLDWEAARAHPKLLVGYSDITALQLALYRHAGWTSLSGPMVAVEWTDPDPRTEQAFLDLARGGMPSPLVNPDGTELSPVRAGSATGVLLGGNLTMIARLIGTPFLPDLEGAILFFEDIGEAPYRIDAILAQFHLAGLLGRLGGVVIGACTEAEPPPGRPTLTLEEMFADWFGAAPYPVASGLLYGHFPLKATLPIGVRARLEVTATSAELHILESVVA